MSDFQAERQRRLGVLPDGELRALVAGMVDPTGQNLKVAQSTAEAIIRLVRANTTCIGDMDRGCY